MKEDDWHKLSQQGGGGASQTPSEGGAEAALQRAEKVTPQGGQGPEACRGSRKVKRGSVPRHQPSPLPERRRGFEGRGTGRKADERGPPHGHFSSAPVSDRH